MDAFKCDSCQNFFEGKYSGSIFLTFKNEKDERIKQVYEICNNCLDEFKTKYNTPGYTENKSQK